MPLSQQRIAELDKLTGLTPERIAELDNIVGQGDQSQSEPQKQGILGKIGEFISPGANVLGKGVGSAFGLASTNKMGQEGQDQLLDMSGKLAERAKQAMAEGDWETANRLMKVAGQGSQMSSGQSQEELAMRKQANVDTARGAASTALDVVSWGNYGKGATAAKSFNLYKQPKLANKAVKEVLTSGQKWANSGNKIVKAGLEGGKTGTLIGASRAAREAENVGEGLKMTGTGLVTGAATGAAVQGGIETATGTYNLLTKALREPKDKAIKIIRNTFKRNKAAERAIKRQGGEEVLIRKMSKMKSVPKSLNGAKKGLDNYRPEFDKKVTAILKKSDKGGNKVINYKRILSDVKDDLAKEFNTPETRGEWKQIESYLDDAIKTYKGNASPKSANALRRRLDKQVGGMLMSETKGREAAVKSFSRKLSNEVKRIVPETKQYFSKYSLLSDLIDIYRKEPAFGLTDITALLAGGTPGVLAGGPLGALSGLATMGVSKAVRSPMVSRMAGSALYNAPKIAEMSSKQASPAIFNALLRAQQGLSNEDNNKNSNY